MMNQQAILDDLFDRSKYMYPESFRFLKTLPNTVLTESGLSFEWNDVFNYAENMGLKTPLSDDNGE